MTLGKRKFSFVIRLGFLFVFWKHGWGWDILIAHGLIFQNWCKNWNTACSYFAHWYFMNYNVFFNNKLVSVECSLFYFYLVLWLSAFKSWCMSNTILKCKIQSEEWWQRRWHHDLHFFKLCCKLNWGSVEVHVLLYRLVYDEIWYQCRHSLDIALGIQDKARNQFYWVTSEMGDRLT